MCGRYLFVNPEEYEQYKDILREIANNLKAGVSGLDSPTAEIFPGDMAPVIPSSKSDRRVKMMQWGFPFYKGSRKIINARSETIGVKKTFKKCIANKRCVIPALGFYEWEKTDNGKVKNIIRIAGGRIMFMAGLYDEFSDKENNRILCFTVITTPPNLQVKRIHNRMPAILDRSHLDIWLNDDIFNKYRSKISSMLKPYKGKLEILPA